jgi:hypothetical protein
LLSIKVHLKQLGLHIYVAKGRTWIFKFFTYWLYYPFNFAISNLIRGMVAYPRMISVAAQDKRSRRLSPDPHPELWDKEVNILIKPWRKVKSIMVSTHSRLDALTIHHLTAKIDASP